MGKLCSAITTGILQKLSERTKNKIDDVLVAAAGRPLTVLIFTGGITLGFHKLSLHETVRLWGSRFLEISFILVIAWGLVRMISRFIDTYIPVKNIGVAGMKDAEIQPVLRKLFSALIWVISGALILRCLGYNISGLLAGLGLGGAALALASKDTLANFFGSITVFVDRPFRFNERIKIAGYDGYITQMGLRTSRLRTMENHTVIIPNSLFAATPIENVSAEPHTKVNQTITIKRDNGLDKITLGVSLLIKICSSITGTAGTPSAGIVSIGGASCQISFIYYVSKDAEYLEVVNKVNQEVLQRFEEAGIILG
ncbi:MAG: mechanosensitive ion channel family protein [Treponema sp.]|nr:mechanosensitive ion channel family protein [Treponema sp.]